MGKPNYKLELPPVLGPDNIPLTVEESERSLREPEHIELSIKRGKETRIYTVLADLDNVDGRALDAYDVFKNRNAAIFAPDPKARRNSKFTAPKDEEGDDEPQVTADQLIKAAKMKPEQRTVFLELLYPADWESNPVILASNLPELPDDAAEAKAWFERGGPYAIAVMEAVVMAIDPTGPLAQMKENQVRAQDMETEMMEVFRGKMTEIQNLTITPTGEVLEPDEEAELDESASSAPSSTPPETEPAPKSKKSAGQPPSKPETTTETPQEPIALTG